MPFDKQDGGLVEVFTLGAFCSFYLLFRFRFRFDTFLVLALVFVN